MDISGSHRIPAPRASVWAGLQDQETLKACIPGCRDLAPAGGGGFEGAAEIKVGPLKSTLEGRVRISQAEEPHRLAIAATAADPAAGGGEGEGEITLSEDGAETLVAYSGRIEPSGKIGQLGGRLVTGVARQSIEAFFTRFSELAAAGALPGGSPAPAPDEPPALTDAPPLVHEEPAAEPAPTLEAPPTVEDAPRAPLEPTPIAPTSVPDVPDPVEVAAAEEAKEPEERSGSVGRIMLVAAIVVVVGIAIYFGFMQRPPA